MKNEKIKSKIQKIEILTSSIENLQDHVKVLRKGNHFGIADSSIASMSEEIERLQCKVEKQLLKIQDKMDGYLVYLMDVCNNQPIYDLDEKGFKVDNLLVLDMGIDNPRWVILPRAEYEQLIIGVVDIEHLELKSKVFAEFNQCNLSEVYQDDVFVGLHYADKLIDC